VGLASTVKPARRRLGRQRHAIADDGGHVLHLLLAETVKAEGELVVDLIVDRRGDHDAAGLGQFLQPRRDVDAVAKMSEPSTITSPRLTPMRNRIGGA